MSIDIIDIARYLHSYLLTTMGMGRVRMKVPASAQKPPSSFPVKVCGDLNRKISKIEKKNINTSLDMVAHGGDGEDAPPHAVQECPLAVLEVGVPLHEEDEGGEGEHRHPHQHHHQPQLLVRLGVVTVL